MPTVDTRPFSAGELLILLGVETGGISEVGAAKMLGLRTDVVAMRARLQDAIAHAAEIEAGKSANVYSHQCSRRHVDD